MAAEADSVWHQSNCLEAASAEVQKLMLQSCDLGWGVEGFKGSLITWQLPTCHGFLDLDIKMPDHEWQLHSLCFISTNLQASIHYLHASISKFICKIIKLAMFTTFRIF